MTGWPACKVGSFLKLNVTHRILGDWWLIWVCFPFFFVNVNMILYIENTTKCWKPVVSKSVFPAAKGHSSSNHLVSGASFCC